MIKYLISLLGFIGGVSIGISGVMLFLAGYLTLGIVFMLIALSVGIPWIQYTDKI